MSKNILLLNGAPRLNGATAALAEAFTQGAGSAGHTVHPFYLWDMNIRGCQGCLGAGPDPASPCRQKDDMEPIYAAFADSQVVAFASPVYFWTITGPLKTAADRLYAELECLGYGGFSRESVLVATAGGADYGQMLQWYRTYEKNLGWKKRGEVLGRGRTEEARRLGAQL